LFIIIRKVQIPLLNFLPPLFAATKRRKSYKTLYAERAVAGPTQSRGEGMKKISGDAKYLSSF